jgi:hypothetical protein
MVHFRGLAQRFFLHLKLGFRLEKISNHLKGILGNSLKGVRKFYCGYQELEDDQNLLFNDIYTKIHT